VKKLLVVANPYPPEASAGTTRVTRFLRHLPEHGWEATVLTARVAGPVAVPPGVPVIRAATPVPARLQHGGRAVGRINSWLFVPDSFAPWVGPAIVRGRRLLREHRFDAILSSAPRPSVHVVAASLSRHARVPWLADFRDPWTHNQFRVYPTPAHRALDAALARRSLARASAVTAVNQVILDGLIGDDPDLAGRAEVLTNGFDPTEPADEVDLGDGLWLVHTGRVYGRRMQIDGFMRAFAALPDEVKLLLLGAGGPQIADLTRELGIAARVRVEPMAPHAYALGCQRAAAALVLINGLRPEAMSSKVFEYLASGRPIFAITPAVSAARSLLDDVGGGTCVLPDQPMHAALAAFVADVRAGTAPSATAPALAHLDVRELTTRLADILDRSAL
jgi:glycosyltransferase involved in cell wall biosynthesis